MPSLFSRQRTTSTPTASPPQFTLQNADEFGRVPPQTPRKDTKYATTSAKGKKDRQEEDLENYEASLRLDDGGFYPFTSLPPILSISGNNAVVDDIPYGHLAHKREVVLSIFQASLLVDDIAHELSQRGLQIPFLFSSQAIDLNPGAVKRLIDSFLTTCLSGGSREKWIDDKKFAGVHELGMVMRWGLARIMRRGERRGMLDFETYLRWRDDEEGSSILSINSYSN